MNTLENNNLLIEINTKGAELSRIYSKTTNKEILWYGDNAHWGRHSPILFPIVGRLKDNETIIDNTVYQMNQHGFARDMNFELLEIKNNSLTYKLESDTNTKTRYPYDFELLITYTLEESFVDINWKVVNRSNSDMYFSIGAHPAFNIPFEEMDTLDNYYLNFKSTGKVNSYSLDGPFVSSKNSVDNLELLNLKPELFKNDALIYDNVYEVSICSKNTNQSINVKFTNFPFVGIWSPYYKKSNSIAPFLCIEPWYGIADSVDSNKDYKSKLGINKLSTSEVFEASYQIKICN